MNGDQVSSTQNEDLHSLLERPYSNERLLCTASVSFMSFALVQTVASIVAGSQAMMGDSAAMVVDSLTYLFNWYAERKKQAYARELEGKRCGKSSLLYRKYTYQLELVPPLLSVSILVILTTLVMKMAMEVLVLDAHRDASLQADPNVHLMMIFSVVNLLLDVLNVFCFAKAKRAFGYQTTLQENSGEVDLEYIENMTLTRMESDEFLDESSREDLENRHHMMSMEIQSSQSEDEEGGQRCHREEGSNLNMCSAYTHVLADTLRSVAVMIAALVAEFSSTVTAEEADAAAAVIVSVLIALSLIPLLAGMRQTYVALKRVDALLREKYDDV